MNRMFKRKAFIQNINLFVTLRMSLLSRLINVMHPCWMKVVILYWHQTFWMAMYIHQATCLANLSQSAWSNNDGPLWAQTVKRLRVYLRQTLITAKADPCLCLNTHEWTDLFPETDRLLVISEISLTAVRSSASVPLTDLSVRNQTLGCFAGGHWCGLKGLITAVVLWTDGHLHTIIVVTVLQDRFGSLCLCECWFVSCQRSSVCCVAVLTCLSVSEIIGARFAVL